MAGNVLLQLLLLMLALLADRAISRSESYSFPEGMKVFFVSYRLFHLGFLRLFHCLFIEGFIDCVQERRPYNFKMCCVVEINSSYNNHFL